MRSTGSRSVTRPRSGRSSRRRRRSAAWPSAAGARRGSSTPCWTRSRKRPRSTSASTCSRRPAPGSMRRSAASSGASRAGSSSAGSRTSSSRASSRRSRTAREVDAGDLVGTVAATGPDGLPTHVHVQRVAEPDLEAPRRAVPSLAGAWLRLCPDPSAILGLEPGVAAAPPDDPAALLARRDAVLATTQEHYFDAPPRIERGWRHHLVDARGRARVDIVNNVAVLGHSHPAVEAAVARQLRLLNTNSRFLYEPMVAFAEALAARFPPPLDTVFLVNTGSESVELAIRLARTATGNEDVIAIRGAYHGWTVATDAITTSVLDNPRALETRPAWAHAVEAPNPLRGRFGGPGRRPPLCRGRAAGRRGARGGRPRPGRVHRRGAVRQRGRHRAAGRLPARGVRRRAGRGRARRRGRGPGGLRAARGVPVGVRAAGRRCRTS